MIYPVVQPRPLSRIIGLDPALSFGWAWLDPRKGPDVSQSGAWSLNVSTKVKTSPEGYKFTKAYELIESLISKVGQTVIYYEKAARHIGTAAAHAAGIDAQDADALAAPPKLGDHRIDERRLARSPGTREADDAGIRHRGGIGSGSIRAVLDEREPGGERGRAVAFDRLSALAPQARLFDAEVRDLFDGRARMKQAPNSRVGQERHTSGAVSTNLFAYDTGANAWKLFHHHASNAVVPDDPEFGPLN